MARRVVFICGFTQLPNEDLGKALGVLVDHKFNGSLRPDHHRLIRRIAKASIHHLWFTRQTYQMSEPDSLPDVPAIIYRFRGREALDPRDKIYCLYRLIAENPRLGPDYTRSVVDLYKDVVEVMMETSGTLQVLSHHGGRGYGAGGWHFPSRRCRRGLLRWSCAICIATGRAFASIDQSAQAV